MRQLAALGLVMLLTACGSSSPSSEAWVIEYGGTAGIRVSGSYTVTPPSGTADTQPVSGTLPQSFKFGAPAGTAVSATGTITSAGTLIVRLYQDGAVCSEDSITNTGTEAQITVSCS
ncbi:hypothetical protein [Deinococcus apachensis]|uniref:hypothetical protein n=1 Tax=Deinococcus apachensis TaxID=309886 RepID=UPI000371CCD9|nr:hypothetical protein [Deinococcus apachensis]